MKHILLPLLLLLSLASFAQERQSLETRSETPVKKEMNPTVKYLLSDWTFSVGGGLELGGTAPLPMPRSIRKVKGFNPLVNVFVEGLAHRTFFEGWGVTTGLRLEQKGMQTKAKVRNYYIEMTADDGGYMEGVWAGQVRTSVHNVYLTIPVLGTYTFNKKWTAHAGPYFSFLLSGNFGGAAYDGYIRHHDPRGEKAFVTHATYDFDNDLRTFVWGLQFGGSYRWTEHWSLNADLDWGVNSIFPHDFKAVSFGLYPIYGQVGAAYWF